jgi:predicted  nucleic acid-binding Zn-ribbon protein
MRFLFLLLLLACAVGAAQADDKPGAREREALRRTQAQLQTVQQAQTALQDKLRASDEEKAALEQRFKGVQSRAAADGQKSRQLQTALDAAQDDNRALQASKAELELRLKAAQERVAVLEKEQAQTTAQLKASESALISRNRQVNSCEKHNSTLYSVGRQLVEQCRESRPTVAAQLPDHLSGAKRVAFETLLEDYRDKLDGERLLPADLAQ